MVFFSLSLFLNSVLCAGILWAEPYAKSNDPCFIADICLPYAVAGVDNFAQLGRSVGGAFVEATDGDGVARRSDDPGTGLPSTFIVPSCAEGWSEQIQIPVNMGVNFDSDVALTGQRFWRGEWFDTTLGMSEDGRYNRFCSHQLSPGETAIGELYWRNL